MPKSRVSMLGVPIITEVGFRTFYRTLTCTLVLYPNPLFGYLDLRGAWTSRFELRLRHPQFHQELYVSHEA